MILPARYGGPDHLAATHTEGVTLTGARVSGWPAWSRWSALPEGYDLDQAGHPAWDDGGGEGDARAAAVGLAFVVDHEL
jgi:hypothetical protein